MTSKQSIHKIIKAIGGNKEIAELYFALSVYGPQTITQLARNAHIERTKVYRLLESMQSFRLIEIELRPKTNIIKPAPLSSIMPIITQKQHDLSDAADALPKLELLLGKQTLNSPLTKVQFYQGQEGAKQMLWNQTKAKSETLSILYQNMQSHTGEDFYIRWAERCNERKLNFRSIVGDEFIKSRDQWTGKTSSGMLKNWHGRFVAETDHKIRFWTCIYDDVVAYFSWHEREIYGIEIYNQDIARANKDFFESLWKLSRPIPTK